MFRFSSTPGRNTLLGCRTLTAAAIMATLAACGGGGDGGGGGFAFPLATPSTPTSDPIANPVPTPSEPANRQEEGRVDPFSLKPGAEPYPSLAQPQPGSTADVGEGPEGIYNDILDIAIVNPDGFLGRHSAVRGMLWGVLEISGLNWVIDSLGYEVSRTVAAVVKGSGTYSPKVSLDGSYTRDGGSPIALGPLRYSLENALAVTQASVTGRWVTPSNSGIGMDLNVAEDGSFTGTTSGSTIGECEVEGTITHFDTSSAKNFYRIAFAANAVADSQKACDLNVTEKYVGHGAILLEPAGTFDGNGAYRGLYFQMTNAAGGYLSLLVPKQR